MNELVHARARVAGPGRASTPKETTRTNDPERTRANILEVAAAEFAEKGLAGARIDEIAALTQTSKRMIYYYFGSKEGLYLAVLEESYKRVRDIEAELHLRDLEPVQAIKELYERGLKAGVFRPGLDPVDIHASISALSFFNVSNRHTFGLIFKVDTTSGAYIAHRRDNVVEMIVRFMRAP
jgi:AcrR family transcriptional regulator